MQFSGRYFSNFGNIGRKRAARILVAWLIVISYLMPSFSFYEGSTLNVYGNTPKGSEDTSDKGDENTPAGSEDTSDKGDENTPAGSEDTSDKGDGESTEEDTYIYVEEEDVYLIGSAKDLRDFATKVNNGQVEMPAYVKLTNDIIFDRPSDEEIKQAEEDYDNAKQAYDNAGKTRRQAEEAYYNAEKTRNQAKEAYYNAEDKLKSTINWTSIGTYQNKFSGIFDGDGHIISGLCVWSFSSFKGLFGYCDDIEIKNLAIDNIFIVERIEKSGGFVGRAYGETTITGSSVFGNINGTDSGGFVGEAKSSVTINGCIYDGEACGETTDKKLLVGYARYYNNVSVSSENVSPISNDSELDIGEVGLAGDIIEPETRNPKAIFIWGAVLVLIAAVGVTGYKIYKKRK